MWQKTTAPRWATPGANSVLYTGGYTMETENKINRFAVDPNKQASYKARKFLRILSGNECSTGITYKELQREIRQYPREDIEKARAKFKGMKRASKYLRAFCQELNALGYNNDFENITRAKAELLSKTVKKTEPTKWSAVKAKLRGMTYEK